MRRLRYTRNALATFRPLGKAGSIIETSAVRMRCRRCMRNAFASAPTVDKGGSIIETCVANAAPTIYEKCVCTVPTVGKGSSISETNVARRRLQYTGKRSQMSGRRQGQLDNGNLCRECGACGMQEMRSQYPTAGQGELHN